MSKTVDLKVVVKHIVDNTLPENLCRICLLPFGDECENIFTKLCKSDEEFCVADVLENVCKLQIAEEDQFSVCINCFKDALTAYKFYLLSQRSTEILNFYVDELEKKVDLDLEPYKNHDSLCISLPKLIIETPCFEFNQSYLHKYCMNFENPFIEETKKNIMKQKCVEYDEPKVQIKDELIVVTEVKGERSIYKVQSDGLIMIEADKVKKKPYVVEKVKEKIRRRRTPMVYTKCSKCPVKYRFIARLKEHMKLEHDVQLFVCKLCKAIIENEDVFNDHLATHTNIYSCAICNSVFKKRNSIIAHLKWHEEMKNLSQNDGVHICELCGVLLPDEKQLKDHYDKTHDKKYTCYYCGRMYKKERSFEMHIKKHEMHIQADKRVQNSETNEAIKSRKQTKNNSTKFMCWTCGKNFVDERALMWHNMLHTDERPYKCEICGRGFVSVNRRNQHAVCAHTAPKRRCPLCPALFHLRSCVNTHIKKVHLKVHKRRNRTSKHQNVFWRTEPVPIQELSVSIQNQLLELKARNQLPMAGLT